MSLTEGQFNQIKNHPNIKWLEQKATRNQTVHQDTIRLKIVEALKSAPSLANRTTDDNVRWVAQKVGIPWGNVHQPSIASEGFVHIAAAPEIEGNDPAMSQAVKMVFNQTAKGRTSPGTLGVNHIHVGGNAQRNILFDVNTSTILGVVNGHMEKAMSPKVRAEESRVMLRKGSPTVRMRVIGNMISRI